MGFLLDYPIESGNDGERRYGAGFPDPLGQARGSLGALDIFNKQVGE